jgi:hypothetical protein
MHPIGLNRSPRFSGYGWNATVAGQLTTPVLVTRGLEDTGVPGGAANYQIRNGLISSWWRYPSKAAALEAAGPRE